MDTSDVQDERWKVLTKRSQQTTDSQLIRFLTFKIHSSIATKQNMNFCFLSIHRCVVVLYTRYFPPPPSPVKKLSQACYLGGIRTHDNCSSRAVSYPLDYRNSRWSSPGGMRQSHLLPLEVIGLRHCGVSWLSG